jgi:hypothetical protein
LYCDENCEVTGSVVLSSEGGVITTSYLDANLQPTTSPPSGRPCETVCVTDYEIVENCYQDTAGNRYKQLLIITLSSGVKSVRTCWLSSDGILSDTEPAGLSPCVEVCDPAVESFLGNNATLALFNEFSVFVPSCCELTITTSAGEIVLPAQQAPFMFCQKFECFISDYVLSGDCVDEVRTILTKTK